MSDKALKENIAKFYGRMPFLAPTLFSRLLPHADGTVCLFYNAQHTRPITFDQQQPVMHTAYVILVLCCFLLLVVLVFTGVPNLTTRLLFLLIRANGSRI